MAFAKILFFFFCKNVKMAFANNDWGGPNGNNVYSLKQSSNLSYF